MSDGRTQVTVFNVGMHATTVQLEKLLKKNGIAYKRARKPPSISHAILTFEVNAYCHTHVLIEHTLIRRAQRIIPWNATTFCQPAPPVIKQLLPGRRQNRVRIASRRQTLLDIEAERTNNVTPTETKIPTPTPTSTLRPATYPSGDLVTSMLVHQRDMSVRVIVPANRNHVFGARLACALSACSLWLVFLFFSFSCSSFASF